MKKIAIFCCGFILLIACATPYKQAKKATANGYFDTPLQEGIYDVTFNGNSDTSAKKAHDYALLRCAEVCLENGYQTFDIVSKVNHSSQDGYMIYNILVMEAEPKINFIVHCSQNDDLTFRAEEIKTNLRTKYKLQ